LPNHNDIEKASTNPTQYHTFLTMAAALTPEQTAIVKSTVPVLAQYGETITTKFYHDLISANPSLKNIFNNTHQATGHQARALAGSLYAYAANLDDLGKLSPAVELICNKHASLNVQAEHYSIVGEFLLKTMKSVLGDAATDELLDAWGAAYWQLANIMIQKEAQMYAETSYWPGWQDFRITRKEKESEEITSFYFEPVDAKLKLPTFKPGQYVSVNMFVEELDGGVWQARQYSLSDAPGKPHLRISVKREPGTEIGEPEHMTRAGYLSNMLHDKKNVGDVVQLSHPFGDFFYDEEDLGKDAKDTPVVLISAGVGLTCLMSILNTLVEEGGSRSITWIQGSRDSRVRAFKAHVDELAVSNKNLHRLHFSSLPATGEVEGQDYDFVGRIDLEKIAKRDLFTENKKTQYFTCGPMQFMLDVETKLKSFGVDSERVHMELFGTGGVLIV
jgi:nitric oxide dioxygenase